MMMLVLLALLEKLDRLAAVSLGLAAEAAFRIGSKVMNRYALKTVENLCKVLQKQTVGHWKVALEPTNHIMTAYR
uniref:Putative secreted protein n=1 Tax=Xenopsylla cheopis TaxID=163159 RepID=A0A6M2E079_XENCH